MCRLEGLSNRWDLSGVELEPSDMDSEERMSLGDNDYHCEHCEMLFPCEECNFME